MVKRISKLTPEQEGRMEEWADRWIKIGLSTERADFEAFEVAARACYRYAGLPEPRVIVRVPSPLVAVTAGPIAAGILGGGAVDGAVVGAVGVAVDGAVDGAVVGAVDGAVHGAVVGAVHGAVHGAVSGAVDGAVRDEWVHYIGGQFWVGGWWGSPAFVSFFTDVCGLELPGDLVARGRAYAATAASASWWWPHRDFIMVSDRPLAIHTELADPARPRGWGSHRLHNETGPAVVWSDGFGVWSWHGTRVEPWVIETPLDEITAEQITGERNAEVRRVLIERVGAERYLRLIGGTIISKDDWGVLWETKDQRRIVELVNSTPEPDGHAKTYYFRVPDTTERRDADLCIGCGKSIAIVPTTPLEAVAWKYRCCPTDYSKLEIAS